MPAAYALAPAFVLEGVRTRRIMALCVDFTLVSVLAGALFAVLFVATLGLSVFFLPHLWPLIAFFYNGLSMSGAGHATPGMRLFGLEVSRSADGGPVPFLYAALHGVLFYFSWLFPLVFLVTLVDPEKRFLHDILAGIVVTRRR